MSYILLCCLIFNCCFVLSVSSNLSHVNSSDLSSGPKCSSNKDCDIGLRCVSHQCKVQLNGKCILQSECEDGMTCVNFKCAVYCPGAGICEGDLQCYAGKCLYSTSLSRTCNVTDFCSNVTANSVCDDSSNKCRCADNYRESVIDQNVVCLKESGTYWHVITIVGLSIALAAVLLARQVYVVCRLRQKRIARRKAAEEAQMVISSNNNHKSPSTTGHSATNYAMEHNDHMSNDNQTNNAFSKTTGNRLPNSMSADNNGMPVNHAISYEDLTNEAIV